MRERLRSVPEAGQRGGSVLDRRANENTTPSDFFENGKQDSILEVQELEKESPNILQQTNDGIEPDANCMTHTSHGNLGRGPQNKRRPSRECFVYWDRSRLNFRRPGFA